MAVSLKIRLGFIIVFGYRIECVTHIASGVLAHFEILIPHTLHMKKMRPEIQVV